MGRRRLAVAARVAGVGLAALMLTACSSPAQNPGGTGKQAVSAVVFAFEPKDIVVRAGETTFAVTNNGAVEHNFVIEDAAGKTVAQIPNIATKRTLELKATLPPAKYTQVCTLPGHKDAGMIGTITAQ